MTLIFIMTLEVTAQGSRHKEVCAWSFLAIFLQFFFLSFSLFVSLTFCIFSFLLRIYLRFLFWPCFFSETSRVFEKKKQGQSRFSELNFSFFFSAFESFWCPPSMCLRTDATSVQGHGNGTYKDTNMNRIRE